MRARFGIECGSAILSALLFAVTLAWRDWVELVFGGGAGADGGSGLTESLVVAVSAGTLAVCVALARIEWVRERPSTSDSIAG
jgi:hypothetical protein